MWDLSLPGYKYLGPGNKLNKGKPLNYNDWVAYLHDHGYDQLLKQGKNPYTNWNRHDEKALQEFTLEDYGGALGKSFFAAKKAAWKLGLIGNTDTTLGKRLRGHELSDDVKRVRLRGTNGESLSNLTASGTMDGAGSGNEAGLRETPIDDVINVSRGPRDYTFASLPYLNFKTVVVSQYYNYDMVWRMTSPYDPNVNVESTLIPNTGSAGITGRVQEPDTGTVGNEKARYYDFYAGMYKYYHVVACRWSVIVENLGGEPLYVHRMYYNTDTPPAGASNEDMMLWRGCETRVLNSPYKAITSSGELSYAETTPTTLNDRNKEDAAYLGSVNYQTGNHVTSRGNGSICELSGEYRPGDFQREIINDAQVENWTLVTANPSLSERLLIRLKPEHPSIQSSGQAGDRISAKVWTKIEYLVEFKELVDGLRWPVNTQPITVTVVNNVVTI